MAIINLQLILKVLRIVVEIVEHVIGICDPEPKQ